MSPKPPIQNDIVPDDESILLHLREQARVEVDGLIRHQLKSMADLIQVILAAMQRNPTPELMRGLNAAWVRAVHYLTIAKGPTPDGSGEPAAGRAEQERVAA